MAKKLEARVYAPARSALKYDKHLIQFDENLYPNRFIGDPSDKVDEAWSQLLQNPYFRVTSSEYRKVGLNRSTLGIVGSDDKVISFSAYHELHCLKTLYRWIHNDHYFPNLDRESDEFNFQKWHAEHCISYLRQATMCTASLVPITLEWNEATPGSPRPRPNPQTPRKCANWKSLDSWAAERKVDLYDLDGLAGMPGRGW
ncbi:hypothetical protein K505DRAFT_356385 [Melanomma pulvis-pyrius CBS 109.77]|uniref:Tat pathway signal sequence n=1 Tax=Melanomma pulvis-pyrius CBS 109.77 TaxID=1314802 RepID=A0A6A6XT95_9PLEO|nr:hypothetical protein K505DRAFT_356385 [Melanomma pulvis-pyrius CBS 109.77]